jgi:hypothetical protein
LADKSADAYEKLVDRLLASPHYGERWARPWLDLARYADSDGYDVDRLRTAWKYRDWVISALNDDLSFRDFTIEQVAGDMLPNAAEEEKIATGFHRNTLLNKEGGADPEEYRCYVLVDRTNTTANTWLGTTLACAQCHNHKFDPFTQRDYYRFLAFFDNVEYRIETQFHGEVRFAAEPDIEFPTAEQAAKRQELKTAVAKIETVLDTPTPELEAAEMEWEKEIERAESSWAVLGPIQYSSSGRAMLRLLNDNSIVAGGKNPNADSYIVQAKTDRMGITGVRLEVLSDPSLPHQGPGRDSDGNFFLSAFEVEAAPADKPEVQEKVTFKEATADDEQEGYGAKHLVNDDGRVIAGWAINTSTCAKRRQVVFVPEKPFGFRQGTLLTIHLKHEMRYASRNLGRFRLSVSTSNSPKRVVELPAKLRSA